MVLNDSVKSIILLGPVFNNKNMVSLNEMVHKSEMK